jgi:thiamine-monophosphate kinase
MTRHLAMGSGAEFDAIRRLLATWGAAAVGIGDDAAIVDLPAGERLVVSTDATVENVHFRRGWLTAEEIGARAAAAALSDLAAMAATPRGLLVALGLPEEWLGQLDDFARGVGAVAVAAACPIIGGNISASRELTLTLTVLGSAAHPLRRAGARPGDIIFVTGRLGGAGAAVKALYDGRAPDPVHRVRFASPVPRIREALWLAARGAHAAIDVSDGLLADAAHLARASGVSIALNATTLPCVAGVSVDEAAASGEEYELIIAAPREMASLADEFSQTFELELTAIGTVAAASGEPVTMAGMRGDTHVGHDHLASH